MISAVQPNSSQIGRRQRVFVAVITACAVSVGNGAAAAMFVSDQTIGERPGQFHYTGRWEHIRHVHDRRFFGSSSRTATIGASVALSFFGRVVRVYGVRGRGGGYGAVTIDDRPYRTIDFYAPVVVSRALVFGSPLLHQGYHRLVITASGGAHAPGHRNNFINISGAVYE